MRGSMMKSVKALMVGCSASLIGYAADQWGRPAGKSTHTGKAVTMSTRNSSARFEQGLDDCEEDDLSEMNINALAIINSELRDSHRDIITSRVRTSGVRELAEAEASLAQLNNIRERESMQNQRGQNLGATEPRSAHDDQYSTQNRRIIDARTSNDPGILALGDTPGDPLGESPGYPRGSSRG